MKLLATIILCGLLFAPFASANAGEVELHPFPQGVILEGGEGSTTMQFAHGGDGSPSLALAFQYSPLLDASASTISVDVDGQSVHSARLSGLPENGRFEISLGALEEGFHLLRIRTNLSIADDPCLERFGREAWVRLLSSSSLTATRSGPSDSLEHLAAEWSGLESVRVDTGLERPGAQLTALETLSLLQGWGLDTQLEPFSYGSSPQWVVRSLEDAPFIDPMLEGLAEELRDASSALRSAVLGTEFAVVVLGRTDEDAQQATAQLQSAETRALCPRMGTCWLGVAPSQAASPSLEPASEEVLHLGDIGYDHGWVAEGNGRHVLRFVWARPGDWSLLRAPEVHLRVRHANEGFVSSERSSITLKLADRPIATWRLNGSDGDERILMAKVPASDWEDDAWAFEVVVQLRHAEGRCDEGEGWLSIEASSALVVEREESVATGLSAFFENTRTQRPALEGALSSVGLTRFAELAGPLARATPGQLWQWATDSSVARLRMGGRDDAAEFNAVHAADIERWLRDGTPALESARTDVLSLSETDERATLLIVPGETNDDTLAPPQYAAWNADVALRHAGEWHLGEEHIVEGERVRVERELATTLPRLASERELRHEHVDRIWMAGLVLSILLGSLWLVWRQRQGATT